jgi:hypothetical protein
LWVYALKKHLTRNIQKGIFISSQQSAIWYNWNGDKKSSGEKVENLVRGHKESFGIKDRVAEPIQKLGS